MGNGIKLNLINIEIILKNRLIVHGFIQPELLKCWADMEIMPSSQRATGLWG
jgi:hypothetical protein